MALRITQSIFCARFLKIELSVEIIMSFSNQETIEALKTNVRDTIAEIGMHTVQHVLQNSTIFIGHCMASRGSNVDETIIHY
uniref:Uncharacterized protein n=1 Tax=Anopheles minimus TaxID=112268 RepID=A0A182W2J2_9DIPT